MLLTTNIFEGLGIPVSFPVKQWVKNLHKIIALFMNFQTTNYLWRKLRIEQFVHKQLNPTISLKECRGHRRKLLHLSSLPSPQKLKTQYTIAQKAVDDCKAHHDNHIYPFVFPCQSRCCQYILSWEQASICIDGTKALVMANACVFVDEQGVQWILEQGSVVQTKPVFRHVLFAYEISRE